MAKTRRKILRKKKRPVEPEELQDVLYDEAEDIDEILELAAEEERLTCGGEMAAPLESGVKKRLAKRGSRTAEKHTGPVLHDIYPLDAPGMPLPGPEMTELAQLIGSEVKIEGKGKNAQLADSDDIIVDLYQDLLYSAGKFHIPMKIKGSHKTRLAVVTGHVWGDEEVTGPKRARVMCVGKCLGGEEKIHARQFVGPTGELQADTCEKLGITDYKKWYVTNLLKTEHPQAATGGSTLKAPWIKEWLPILHQELRIVQPQYMLLLGADAIKAVLGKEYNVKNMEGRVVELTYPISREAGPAGEVVKHTTLVMAVMHPAAVLRAMEQLDVYESGMARFGSLINGNRPDKEEEGLDHREIDTLEELIDLTHEIEADCEDNLLGVDAEWHGDHPENKNAYVRMVQISWAHKKAVAIHLTHPGGKWRFKGSKKQLAKYVNRICKNRRVAGHFLNADLEWLIPLGIDLRKQFSVADTWEGTMEQATRRKNPQGGVDTGMMLHSIAETDDFALTSVALRFTSAPRYDVELYKWRDAYCNKHKLKKKDMEGYGECPDDVLTPYGIYDADVTRRAALKLQKLLTKDRFGNNCWEAYWMSMRAAPACLEINRTGLVVDRKRMERLTSRYIVARATLEKKIRDWARWPTFNLNSVYQVREFLFGEDLNGKELADPDDPPIRLRPKTGRSLRLEPIISTDKRPMRWEEVVQRKLETEKTPSTNKTSLAILAQDSQTVLKWSKKKNKDVIYDFSDQVTWIRDYRFISQVLKQTLRVPELDDETDDFIRDDAGWFVYPGGLPQSICDDGRVRTHMYQTKETRRWASARPPLQNLSKRRESDYKRILGSQYLWPIRTIIRAPKGKVLIEADYTGAELYGMAVMSGDKKMIAHAQRNILDESDPNFYDIHSNIAVLAFNLDCAPTKAGLYSIGKVALRVAAKNVIFGVAYGRGAKAIALQAKEEGNPITVEQAKQIINTIFSFYPDLEPFFEECKRRASNPRWLCGCFGGFRRFQMARDRATVGDFERQAMNFPIQGMIADAVSRACDHLYHYRFDHPEVDYRIALQIHDAVVLEVAYEHVPQVINEVLPECMVNRVPIHPSTLDGMPTGEGPYHMGIDIDPYVWWGEDMMPSHCLRRNIDPMYAKWEDRGNHWTHPHYVNKKNEPMAWVGDINGGKLVEMAELA